MNRIKEIDAFLKAFNKILLNIETGQTLNREETMVFETIKKED